MMLSQFFILSAHGDTLAFRDFRGEVVRGTPEIFYRRIKLYKGAHPPPVFNVEGTQFLHIVKAGLYFVCTTTANVAPVFILELLQKIAGICKDYCGVLDEEAIRCNFALVYEILDEILDFGYPQCTSSEVLKDYVFNESYNVKQSKHHSSNVGINTAAVFGAEKRTLPSSAPNKSILASQHRLGGKNEVFIDILERLTVLISANGQIIRSEIDGCIKVRSFLAGSPEIHLGLNENIQICNTENNYDYTSTNQAAPVILEDHHLNECVDVEEFDKSRCLTFKPPGGECTAMTYHIIGEVHLPFRIHSFMEVLNDNQISLDVKLFCDVPNMFNASSIVVTVPAPRTTLSATHKSSTGANSFEYISKEKVLKWSIKRMNGGTEHSAKMTFKVPVVTNMSKKEVGPINLDFEFPMFVCSKIQIKYLKVTEQNSMYTPMRWIRYITHSDSYVRRI